MNLLVHQVMELEHIHDADGHRCIERLPGPSVEEKHLSGGTFAGELQHLLHLRLARSVEHVGVHRNASAELSDQLLEILLRQFLERLIDLGRAVDFLEVLDELLLGEVLLNQLVDPFPQATRRPTEVGLQNLSHVHARRNAQRIEHEIDRTTVHHIRKVLLRQNPGDDSLVPVAAGHLVADGEFALDRDIDLDDLDHPRRKLVPLGQAAELLIVHHADHVLLLFDALEEIRQFRLQLFAPFIDADLGPPLEGNLGERRLRDLLPLLEEDLLVVLVHHLRR